MMERNKAFEGFLTRHSELCGQGVAEDEANFH
jgi:hypothetical protein